MNETRTVRPKWPNNLWLLISDPMAPIVFPQYKMGSNPSSSPHTRLPPAPSPPSPVARSLSRSLSPIACRRDGRRAAAACQPAVSPSRSSLPSPPGRFPTTRFPRGPDHLTTPTAAAVARRDLLSCRHGLFACGAEDLRLPARQRHRGAVLRGRLPCADAIRHPLPARLDTGPPEFASVVALPPSPVSTPISLEQASNNVRYGQTMPITYNIILDLSTH
jgi:hypothetical protein